MLNPVFNPATLTLTAGAVVGFDGTTFVDAPNVPLKNAANTFTANQAITTSAGVGLQINCTDAQDPMRFVRASDSHVGVRVIGHTGFQVMSNLIVGGSGSTPDDGNSRFFFYSGSTPKMLFTPSFSEFASDIPFRWSTSTAVTGSVDTGFLRAAAGVLALYDGDATGDPALGFQAKSSTTGRRDRARIATAAVDNTDATRKYRAVFSVYDTAAREFLRGEASGAAPMIGFLGASAVARPAVTGSRGGNAALASLLTALANLGLITDSTTA